MKSKIILTLGCLILLATLFGCQKNGEPQVGRYMTEDNLACVDLQDGYRFLFNRHIATSYRPVGTYSVEKDKLILTVADDEYYIFLIENGQLIYDSCLPEGAAIVKKGTVFKLVSIIPDYIPYAQIPADYTLEDAIADGLIVHKDLDIKFGQDIWDDFLKLTQSGTPCMVRIAYYHTLGNPWNYSREYYEEIKDDYPLLFIEDLTFDGEIYTLFSIEEGEEYAYEYKYLKQFEEAPTSKSAIYSHLFMYVLVNDNDITWEEIQRGMVSSQFGDFIPHSVVYYDYTYNDPNRNP